MRMNISRCINGRVSYVEKTYNCLNGIKGLASLEIACIYHLATINYPYKSGEIPFENVFPFTWCYQKGGIFVELFLLLSGFLAFYVYSEKIAEGMSFTQYMKRRVMRIFPLMWITLGTTVILDLIYGYLPMSREDMLHFLQEGFSII